MRFLYLLHPDEILQKYPYMILDPRPLPQYFNIGKGLKLLIEFNFSLHGLVIYKHVQNPENL